ncbi:MAG: transcriptional repressor LexA [Elusimicrobiota bacterium]
MDARPTPAQAKIFDFVARQVRREGLPPTVREIAAAFKVSIGTVQDHLAALERKGLLNKAPEKARGLLIPLKSDAARQRRLPILGRVPAGNPIEAISDVADYLSVDEEIAKRANFALRVKGDSMHPRIEDGDMVLVRITPTAQDGDIVVAYFQEEGEATVKLFRRKGADPYLEPINPKYSPITKPFSILGTVTSLIRPSLR